MRRKGMASEGVVGLGRVKRRFASPDIFVILALSCLESEEECRQMRANGQKEAFRRTAPRCPSLSPLT